MFGGRQHGHDDGLESHDPSRPSDDPGPAARPDATGTFRDAYPTGTGQRVLPYSPPDLWVRNQPPPAPPPRTYRRGLWVAIGAAVIALAVAAGVLVGFYLAGRQSGTGACAGRATLRLAVAPELAPIVERAAGDFTVGACRQVTVVPREPAEVLGTLAKEQPDGWVPPASAWLRLAASPAAAAPGNPSASPDITSGQAQRPALFADRATSLVRSPVVVAAPKPFAISLGWPAKQPGWAELVGGTTTGQIRRFSMENPLRGTAGLLSVLGVQNAMARTVPDKGLAQMRALTFRSRLADAEADPAELLRRAAAQTDPAKALTEIGLFPVTEQALWKHVRDPGGTPLVAVYPADGMVEADYPLALSSRADADRGRRDLGARLVERIQRNDFIDAITESGFRPATRSTSGGARPVADGLLPQYPTPLATPASPADVFEPAAQWAQYRRLPYQVLILVDGSGSMNQEVRDRAGKITTKAQLLRLAGGQAAQLFGEETSLAMWLFATPAATSPPFTEVVPFGPVDEKINGVPRREVLRAAAQGYQAYPSAGTPLYETVLRGVTTMRDRYRPGAVTLVVVLTDGREQDSPYTMTREQFFTKLTAARDPARPVPVFSIGYGGDADMATLNDVGRVTGGRAVASNDPGDLASAMAQVFLAAHSVR